MNNTESNLRNDLQQLEQQTSSQDQFRLAQARSNALTQTKSGKKSYFWPALGTSFASLALVGVLSNPLQQTEPTISFSSTGVNTASTSGISNDDYPFELSVDMMDDSIDLYEDLDFYDWLAQAES
jgi:hypothetical protein